MRLPFTKAQAACVVGGLVLYALIELATGMNGQNHLTKGALKRAGPGQGETSYEILVSGLDQTDKKRKIPVELPVSERQYTDNEAKELFEKILPEFKKQMLGENKSLDEVKEDLNFMSSFDAYGLKINWESDNPNLIDSFGVIHNEEVSDKGETTRIRARLTHGEYEHTYEFEVTVFPPVFSSEEKMVSAFKKWAVDLDEKQQTSDCLLLPEKYEGQNLTYWIPKQEDYWLIPVLGIFMAVLLHVKEEMDRKDKKKKREQQLLFDYSEVVSKLVVYLGAGITLRGSWERIASGYDQAVKQGKRCVRPAYEEMMKTAGQLGSGQAQGHAFREFGRRCGLQSYLKLATLLEQSQKNGSKQLRSLLELEMVSAFEQRKNLAKKLGEEAGTKLLLPLLLMLGVIMVMIVVPAFLAFY